MNRGVEIDSDVADGPHSVILEQVTNGVAIRMFFFADAIFGTSYLPELLNRLSK